MVDFQALSFRKALNLAFDWFIRERIHSTEEWEKYSHIFDPEAHEDYDTLDVTELQMLMPGMG